MKPDLFTKVALAVIAIMLALAAVKPLVSPDVAVRAQAGNVQRSSHDQARQAWEYTIIKLGRSFTPEADGVYLAGDWETWRQDGNKLATPVDIVKKLSQLGGDGWELVSVNAESSNATSSLEGRTSTICSGALCRPTDAQLQGASMAGASNGEVWVFKRPKP